MRLWHYAGMALLAMLLFYVSIAGSQSTNLSGKNITYAINSTESFVNSVNKSTYLIFYPNLTGAYNYIAQAKVQQNSSYAYVLLSKARSDAQAQLDRINSYKRDSLYVLVASALFLTAVLYALMSSKKRKGSSRKNKPLRQASK